MVEALLFRLNADVIHLIRNTSSKWWHSSPGRNFRSDGVPEETNMEDNTLVKSSFSATIHAPIENVDIPTWCFGLSESEYQSCSPAHVSAGVTTAPDGRRMSINVEVLGGSPMVQHYVEEIAEPHHLRLVSNSDVFTPTGRIKVGVIWDLSVKKIDDDYLRVYQCSSQLLHAGAPGLSGQTGHSMGGLPSPPASPFPRRTTGRRRLCLPRVLSVMHCGTAIPPGRECGVTYIGEQIC